MGLEPVERFVTIARDAHPPVEFRLAELADLADSDERWAGITGSRLEAFSHPATTAYRWPMEDMNTALDEAGFDVIARRHAAGGQHASVVARPTPHRVPVADAAHRP